MKRQQSRKKSLPKKAAARPNANQKQSSGKQERISSSGESSGSRSRSMSGSGSGQSSSGSENSNNEVIFSKNTYIAFMDPSGDLETFNVGFVLEDHREVDQEVLVDVYEETGPCRYKRGAKSVSIAEYCIIGDVAIIKQKPKKGQKPSTDTIAISQQNFNRLSLLMENVGRLKDIESGSDESDNESDEEEEESESQEGERDSPSKIKGRRLVAASKVVALNKSGRSVRKARSVSTKEPPKSQMAVKTQSKGSKKNNAQANSSLKRGGKSAVVKKTKSVAPSKKGRGQLSDDEEEKEEDDHMDKGSESALVQTRKSGGQGAGSKKARALTQMPQQIGKKRPARGNLSDDGSDDDQSNDEERSSVAQQKKKLANGKAQSVKPATGKKKPQKMPTEFKKGKWNPNVELLDVDFHKESEGAKCLFDCCMRCNNKNLIRAAITGNEKLLANCIDETKQISSLTAYWSPEIKWTAIEYMVINNEHHLMEQLMHPKLKVPAHSTYENERNVFFSKRAQNSQYLLNFVDSGMVSDMAYGARVRKVQMTRGNKQGNNAFLQYPDNPMTNPIYYLQDESFLKRIFYNPGEMTVETFKMIYKLNPNVEHSLNTLVYEAVRAGNRVIAYEIVKSLVKFPNWGFNNLHMEALGKAIEQEKILKVSITKKANTNQDITPLHCACINPNPKIIKQFLDIMNNEIDVPDSQLRRPIHYAAANENAEPIRLLIKAGASVQSVDNQKSNCLHIAAMTGRAATARAILETNIGVLHSRNKQSMTPIAFACKYGHVEVVKVLVEFKAKVNVGAGAERLTPIQWAATYGHYELCEYLLDEAKARVLGKDKYKRTALTMAVRNGHTKLAALLLQRGSEWDHPDSSVNTPLHYAAAYGWLDCMNLLLKTGADVNAQNSWKITPINIAMLKNHQGCVKRLLDEPDVDVNCKDEKGRTLLMLAVYQLDDESEEFIRFLLKKGANPNIADLEGQTVLHYIAKYQHKQGRTSRGKAPRKATTKVAYAAPSFQFQQNQPADGEPNLKEEYQNVVEIQKNVTTLLIKSGADLSHKDNNNKTAFALCLDNDNAPLLNLLKNQISFNAEPELFFSFESKIFNVEYQKIMNEIIENDPPTIEVMNYLNDEGLTPFLAYIRIYSEEWEGLLNDIQLKVNQQSFVHGNNKNAYKITNKDLFEKFQDNTNYHTHNPAISQEEKNAIARKILEEIVIVPFIKALKLLLKKGADPNAQVQKLKRYRDEEVRKREEILNIQQNGPQKETEEDKVKKREEVLREQRSNKSGKGLGQQNYGRKGYGGSAPRAKATAYSTSVSQLPDKIEHRDGKKVVREYGELGLRNAFHLVVDSPEPLFVELLVDLKLNPDLPDYDQVTPFNLISKGGTIGGNYDLFRQQLISLDVRIDYPDIKGRTPFLNYYEKRDVTNSNSMLELGANVNQMDNSGLFALKYALIRRDNAGITLLLEKGANINQIDNKGRNLLHHAVNMSSATADATFETEQFLIDHGVELNLRDSRGRTPLHYAFVKIQDWKGNSQIDPIETVSSLCGCRGLQLDVADKWLKTPLHYASQRGASCCAMYLIQKGASSEKIDIYNNTPLGVCLLNHHYNYGILLIQNNSNVNALVYRETPEELALKWKKEEQLYKKTQKKKQDGNAEDEEMDDEEGEQDQERSGSNKKKSHRNMFKASTNLKNDYYGEEDDYGNEDYDNEDYDEEDDGDDYRHENAFNQQNAFGINVYKTKSAKKSTRYGGYYNNQQAKQYLQPGQSNQYGATGSTGDQPVRKDELEGCSLFKLAIRAGQQGLAYLMMNNGYNLMLCIQDAMDEKKFMLVLTLMAKTAEDEVVQQKNNKAQNLFHILSMNASSCQHEHLVRIYRVLITRGVDCKAKDNFKRTALHYAVIGRTHELVKLLLTESQNAYDPNGVDIYDHTPLSLCLKGKNAASIFYTPLQKLNNIFDLLVTHGADVNFVYPEEEFKPAFKEDQVDDEAKYNPKKPYKCCILINVVRQEADFTTVMRQNILGLLEHGAKLNVVDSDGRDALMYAIINNNEQLVKMLLQNQKAGKINTSCQDKIGKSAAHYVVNPLKFGSYENANILKDLHAAGFNLKLKDNQNRTPASYAQEQESGVLLGEFIKFVGREGELGRFQRALSIVDTQHWPQPKVDHELDSDAFMQIAQEKEELEHKDKKIPVDPTGSFERSYEVYYDEDGKAWDNYLVKVDLKNGIYGDYVFYRMQLLYDTNRDLYVVFTRWGRIGEDGMNQRSPFNNVAEAKLDYSKIFKSKTGNNFDDIGNFIKQKKKYNIARINYITTDYKDYLSPFNYELCPRSRLHKEVYDLFEEISNVTMYQRAMNSFGVDTNVLPFSGIKKEVIIHAKEILGRIQEAVKEDAEISKAGIKADYDELSAVKEKISQLSSEYYELVPLANYKNSIAPPLSHQHSIKAQYDNLENLTYIEYASKILLGAVYRQKEINPVDYVYHALNMLIEPLEENSPEHEVISTYIKNTRTSGQTEQEVQHIFKIQRKGEAEMMQAYKDIPNHLLLFHGSQMFNFLGILSQGLRIAPPEAPPTGYIFGKGVYFADMFEKSANYNYHWYHQQESSLMLLCEVALGKSKEVMQGQYIEELEPQFQSLKGLGRTGPDYDNLLMLPNGTKIPYGKVKDYYAHLNQNNQGKSRVAQSVSGWGQPAQQFGGTSIFGQPQNPLIPQLQNNEYVVYNTSQIRMRYLIQMKKKEAQK